MTFEDEVRRHLTRRQRQDLIAAGCITIGGAGLVICAFIASPLAGTAAVCAFLIGIGIMAGIG